MGVKPNVPGKPQAAVPQAAPQPGVPKQPGLALKSRAPKIGGAKRKINESTVITVVIILIFLLIGGMSYKYLGQNSGAGGGTADAASVSRDVLSGQNGNGPNTLVGNGQENKVGRENIGITGDTSITQRGNVNGQAVYEAGGGIGGQTGINSRFSTGANGAGNGKAPQGFITGENVVGGSRSGINRGYDLGSQMGPGSRPGAGNGGNGGQGPNPNAHRPGFDAW